MKNLIGDSFFILFYSIILYRFCKRERWQGKEESRNETGDKETGEMELRKKNKMFF